MRQLLQQRTDAAVFVFFAGPVDAAFLKIFSYAPLQTSGIKRNAVAHGKKGLFAGLRIGHLAGIGEEAHAETGPIWVQAIMLPAFLTDWSSLSMRRLDWFASTSGR